MPKAQVNVRAAAVAATWSNKKTAAARAQHHHVRVNGTEYRSVRAAFEELHLPLEKHISFRLMLKQRGKVSFDYKKRHFNFVLVKSH